MTPTLYEGDNRIILADLIACGIQVHSVVTDPPYGLVSITKRFGSSTAAPAKHGKDGAFARASRGFMGKCYHPDTEVLTKNGWRKINDVCTGDVVATLDPSTRELTWQPVGQCYSYDYDGELTYLKHRSCEQKVTPNHQVLMSANGGESLRLTEAADLPRTFHLFAQCKPVSGTAGSNVEIVSHRLYGAQGLRVVEERKSFEPCSFFMFFGLWLGDGYVVERNDDHPANDYFGFAVRKNRKVEAIRNVLKQLNIRFKETRSKKTGVTSFYCYDFALLGFLKGIGKAKQKHIPLWMFDRDASELEFLYKGLIESDGNRQLSGQEAFFTSSPQLADDFQRLCLHTGRSAISIYKPAAKNVKIQGVKVVASDGWALSVIQPGKRMYAERSRSSSNVYYTERYKGLVHCVGVAEHHILYTRYNGKPVWSGNSWDGTAIERDPEFWRLVYDILLPGGYCIAFSGSRTGHWQAVAMEQAGFIMHPMIGWVTGQGFPKAHSAREAGPEWEGWAYGTQSLKPALEPIYMAQKPFSEKNGAANILKHGVGAINIDGCRVPVSADDRQSYGVDGDEGSPTDAVWGERTRVAYERHSAGRHPTNLIHDGSDDVVALFPQTGPSSGRPRHNNDFKSVAKGADKAHTTHGHEDAGGSAARFFNSFPPVIYQPKAGKADRANSKHPTVKPIALMQHLCRLVTPPGGTVLDPFAGSGTTGEAARLEGFDSILIEREPEYISDIKRRFGIA